MKYKLKKVLIPFVLMLVFNLGIYYLSIGKNFGLGYSPHVGVLLISGVLLGPYGAAGSVLANFLCDMIRGYGFAVASVSAVVGFGISYLAYKLWYQKFSDNIPVTRPGLDNTYNVVLFFGIILICAALYSILHENLLHLLNLSTISLGTAIDFGYFINFINSSFIFGIIGIWLSKRFDFFHIPEKSNKQFNKKLYSALGISLIVLIFIDLISDFIFDNTIFVILKLVAILVLMYAYLTKPFASDISKSPLDSISESIMNRFLMVFLILVVFVCLIASDPILIEAIDNLSPLTSQDISISMLVVMDIFLLIFTIPAISVLRYIERKVINPITSFSRIENFIHENQKIEAEGLLEVYSKYLEDNDEIGTLARSYTNLINHNNNYIENINEIEGERHRIMAELDIATKIQQANLPTQAIDNEYFKVGGYSQPAKEVGGDFFDYYELDENNLAIVIGDASGKGVPAALLAVITQSIIKQLLKHESDPSRILHALNNQLCENNSEVMFITLWLGIYNRATQTLTFSNAGHNPPLLLQKDGFEYLKVDEGIVLGIMEDFEFKKEELLLTDEIIAYTDGITDANNADNEMYGEDNLKKFFNSFRSDEDPIAPLLDDIASFVGNSEQFDDMTLVYLRIKHD
ncbi:SpoIIE family protein phosphatase [Methanobrevibacter sp.]|uniref:SpoIIE family protein phosphatase n=1 Tax=Methanobrevibacter sp. TaxID=66852 RepID=UPI00386B98B1